MRTALVLASLVALAAPRAVAQDAPPAEETTPDAPPSEPVEGASGEPAASAEEASEAAAPAEAPKVAVVVAGDPDPSLRDAAQRVERASGTRLRIPFDPGLRAALRGEAGEEDDGLEEVRRERRRLGLDEGRDAPVLASLGRRAGANVVAIVRAGDRAPELLVLDVRNAAFYEGTLSLTAELDDARIVRFVAARARAAARGAPVPQPVRAEAPAAATEGEPEQPAHQPDFFEQFWPYLVAGVLLAGLITAIAVTSATAGSDQPVLRFVPGGP